MKKIVVKLTIFCVGLVITSLMFPCLSNAKISGVVGIWLLDEGKGDKVNDSFGNHDGVITGKATWAKGKFGGALDFDGSTMVKVPDDKALRLGKNQTITLWLNPSAETADWARLVGKGGNAGADIRNYGLWRAANKSLLYQIFDGADWGNAMKDGDPAVSAAVGEWKHMAGVYDGTSMKLYVNGTLAVTAAYAKEPKTPEDPLTIGYSGWLHTYFKGMLDEIGVFNVPLSDADINDIMKRGLKAAAGVFAVSSEGKLASTWGEIKE